MTGFERIIRRIAPEAKVLDVGAWGLGGENTTKILQRHFGNVTCLNREQIGHAVDIVTNFYTYNFKEKFDVIVLDLDGENNAHNDWTDKQLERNFNLLNEGGILINYIQTMGRRVYDIGNISNWFNIIKFYPEDRRPDIVWVALKKK